MGKCNNVTDLTEYLALVRQTIAELDGIMKVSAKDRAKDLVKSAMGRSVRSRDPMFWPAGMLMLGLVEARDVFAGKLVRSGGSNGMDSEAFRVTIQEIDDSLMRHISLWKDGYKSKIDYIDDALAGAALLKIYEQDSLYGKESVGDSVSSAGEINPSSDLKSVCIYVADRIYEYLSNSPIDPEGTIVYNPGRNAANVFADGVGQTSLFLSLYGRLFKNMEALDLAGTQLNNYMKYGCDVRSGLIYHGYSLERVSPGQTDESENMEKFKVTKKGILSWGRAAGWLVMGLSEYVRSVRSISPRGTNPIDTSEMEIKEKAVSEKDIAGSCGLSETSNRLAEWYRDLSSTLWSYQREDGCFGWQVQALEGPVDSSATGMIVYGLTGYREDGSVPCRDTAAGAGGNDLRIERAMRGMAGNISLGKVQNALSSCDDFGVHYQSYGHYPWGQGAVLAALSKIMV